MSTTFATSRASKISNWGVSARRGGGLSNADGQRVHRQEDKRQDEQAADGGPDPGFHGRVHGLVAAAG
jgi:hypothetical protein